MVQYFFIINSSANTPEKQSTNLSTNTDTSFNNSTSKSVKMHSIIRIRLLCGWLLRTAGGCKEVLMPVSNDPGFLHLCDHNVTAFYYSLLRSWQWWSWQWLIVSDDSDDKVWRNEWGSRVTSTGLAEEMKKCLNVCAGKWGDTGAPENTRTVLTIFIVFM